MGVHVGGEWRDITRVMSEELREHLMVYQRNFKYRRSSVARTLIARLPWLFRTRSLVPLKKIP